MNDKKLRTLGLVTIVVILLMAIVAAGCTTQQTATPTPVPTSTAQTKNITDMDGKTVTIPANITKVLTTHNPINILVVMLAPDKLEAGLNLSSSKYIKSSYANNNNAQPNSTEQGTPNYEQYLAYNPDVILYDYYVGGNTDDALADFQTHVEPVPVIAIMDATDATNYTPEIRFMGNLLGNPQKADQLIAFYEKVYNKVNNTTATIPASQRKSVYYAEGPQGLQTDGPDSFHSSLITIAGGNNVASVPFKGGSGMTPVSMEQVLKWNPDVIIAGSPPFYNTVYNNTTWSSITAVKNHQVYLIPQQPFNWFDRPPGENRIIGIAWTAKVLYPEKYQDMDMKALTKEFYSDFYNYNLTDNETASILSSSGLKQF